MALVSALDIVIRVKPEGGVAIRRLEKDVRGTLGRIRIEGQKTSKGLKHAFDVLQFRPLREVERDIKRIRAAYARLARSGQLSGRELYKAQIQMKTQIAALRAETNGWVNAMAQAKMGLLGLAAAGYSVVKVFGAYEGYTQRMAEVFTLVDASREKFAALSREILEMTRRIPQSAEELAAAEYDIISAGVAMSKSTKVLELSAKAAVAGVTDTKTAVRAGLGVLNAYSMGIDRLGHVYDVLFETVRQGVTTFPELSQYLGEVLPVATAAKVGFESVAAAIATMTKAGMRTPIATTALKGAIKALSVPTPEAKKKFEALGITWKGLIPTLEELKKRSLSLNQLRALVPDTEALNGVITLLNHLDGLKKTLGDMKGAAGAMEEANSKMADTPANKIKLFKNELENLEIQLGGVLSKGLLPVVEGLELFVGGLQEADPATKSLVTILAAGLSALALWRLGLASLVMGLKGLAIEAGAAAASTGALGVALGAMNVAYAAIQIGRLAYQINEYRRALAHLREAQDYWEKQAQAHKDFAEVEIKTQAELAKMTDEELEQYRRRLAGAIRYYGFLKASLTAQAQETNWLGKKTEAAKEAEKELGRLTQQQEQYIQAVRELRKEAVAPVEGFDSAKLATDWKTLADSQKKAIGELGKSVRELMVSYRLQEKELELSLSGAKREQAVNALRAKMYDELTVKVLNFYAERSRALDAYLEELRTEASKEGANAQEIEMYQEEILAAKVRVAREAKAAIIAALDEALNKERQYTREIENLNRQIAAAQMDLESQLRDLRRSRMDQEEAQADKMKEAWEKVSRAQAELARGNYELAKKGFGDAQRLFGEVARSAKDEGTFREAYRGFEEAGQGAIRVMEQIRAEKQRALEDLRQSMEGLSGLLKNLNTKLAEFAKELTGIPQERKAQILFGAVGLDDIKREYDAIRDKTVTVTVKQQTVEAHSGGGLVGWRRFATGGKVPGWGGRDTVKAWLTPGEYVHTTKSVAYYGVQAMRAINERLIPREALLSLVPGLRVRMPTVPVPSGVHRSSFQHQEVHVHLTASQVAAMTQRGKRLLEELGEEIALVMARGGTI